MDFAPKPNNSEAEVVKKNTGEKIMMTMPDGTIVNKDDMTEQEWNDLKEEVRTSLK